MRLLFFWLLYVLLAGHAVGQKYLALENTRQFYRIVFQTGDHISFRTHDSKAEFGGVIQSVDDSMLVIVIVVRLEEGGETTNIKYEDSVPLREIKSVRYQRGGYWQFFRNLYGGGTVVGGAALLGITGINYLTDKQRTPIDRQAVNITLGMMASGVLVWLIGSRKYKKLGKKWRIRTLQPFE